MKNKIVYIALGISVCLFTFCVMALNNDLNKTTITTSSQALSNKKVGWGIKRVQNHEQPDLGSNNLKMLQEHDGIAMGNAEDN